MDNPQSQSQPLTNQVDRRRFLGSAAAAMATAGLTSKLGFAGNEASTASQPEISAFIKFVQSLSYDDMAAAIADLGFAGIESTVRRKGHVLPERVVDDLPKQMEACKKHGIDITIAATDVVAVDTPHAEDVLKTAASLGIKKYRMGFYRYDLKRSIMEQLDEIKPRMKELAAMNRELGITAVYQNHSGDKFVGSPLWDIRYLLEDIPLEEIGVAYDIRHATIEGGYSWEIDYDVMKPFIGALFMKDYEWIGKKAEHVPLGEGRVNPKFMKMHQASGISCPISLHVEYLRRGDAQDNLAALKRDLKVLRKWMS